LINFQLEADVFKHLHDLMIVYRIISLLLLFKTGRLRLLACHYLHPSIDLIKFMCDFEINSEVLWIIFNTLYIFFRIFFFRFNINRFGRKYTYRFLMIILGVCYLAILFIPHKLIIMFFIDLLWPLLLSTHFIRFINYKSIKGIATIQNIPSFKLKQMLILPFYLSNINIT
jgi:hypothetical protein